MTALRRATVCARRGGRALVAGLWPQLPSVPPAASSSSSRCCSCAPSPPALPLTRHITRSSSIWHECRFRSPGWYAAAPRAGSSLQVSAPGDRGGHQALAVSSLHTAPPRPPGARQQPAPEEGEDGARAGRARRPERLGRLPPPRVQLWKEEELEEQFQRGSGPGGQKINKTACAVILRHFPSGIQVRCQKSRSQSENRKLARKMLNEKLEVQLHGADSRTMRRAAR
jgi:hypothetical protein